MGSIDVAVSIYLVGGLEHIHFIYVIILPVDSYFSRWAHCTTNQKGVV